MKDLWKDRNFLPMLLKEIDEPFDSEDYIFELKFDGIRALIFVNEKSIYIQSRNGIDLTDLFPELECIKNQINKNVIFDGEIVLLKNGKPDFSEVQRRIRIKDKLKIETYSKDNPVTFVVFDILYEDRDLTGLQLMKRKEILSKYKDSDNFIKTKFIEEKGIELFKEVKKLKLEGIVAKKKDGLYYINKRTDDFIKIKNIQDGEFFVGGYEKKKNDILSLSIGEYINSEFHFIGKVSIRESSSIYDDVINSRESKNYFSDFNENIFYIKPSILCNVSFLERTKSNHLRHPVYREK